MALSLVLLAHRSQASAGTNELSVEEASRNCVLDEFGFVDEPLVRVLTRLSCEMHEHHSEVPVRLSFDISVPSITNQTGVSDAEINRIVGT